jgi:hypothetical protein
MTPLSGWARIDTCQRINGYFIFDLGRLHHFGRDQRRRQANGCERPTAAIGVDPMRNSRAKGRIGKKKAAPARVPLCRTKPILC